MPSQTVPAASGWRWLVSICAAARRARPTVSHLIDALAVDPREAAELIALAATRPLAWFSGSSFRGDLKANLS